MLKVDTAKVKKEKSKASKKNCGAPKRPASGFFVFMEEFRKSYKEKFPEKKLVAVVGKAGGEKWKSMPESECGADKPEESDKSSSEVHDAPEQEASS